MTTSDILVGVDGSAGARDAVAFARELARVAGAALRLVNAFPYDDAHSRASNGTYRAALRDDAEALLAGVPGDAVRHVVADVSPPHAIHRLAEETGAALVVVGSTARGRIGRVLPGSTGERLLHGSPCPVAIVPQRYAAREHELRAIGVGFDGSEASEAALHSAYGLARRIGASLRVIRVFDPAQLGMTMAYGELDAELETTHREALERRVADLAAGGVPVTGVFRIGNPGRELAALSEELDLLVVGSRGYGPVRAVLLGGVSHALVIGAACPVIVLPRGVRSGLEALLGSDQAARA
jgi:nucleotide-binding universal stress UspA family protein